MPELLNNLLNDPEMSRLLITLLSGGAAAIVGIMLVQIIYDRFSPASYRVKQLTNPNGQKNPPRQYLTLKKLTVSLAQFFTPKKGKEVTKIQTQLEYAGYTNPNALKLFFGSKFLLSLLAVGIAYIALDFFPEYTDSKRFIAIGAAGFVGMIIPNKILEHYCDKRLNTLRKAFPDSLDLLLVCVEAGLGLNAAIQRVSAELTISHPELSLQYARVNEEIQVGVDRVKALKNFANRTQLEDAENLVNLLAQSMKYGTSIAETLRIFAAELRDKRIQSAEEQAAMVGTKLIFPLVLCIFPAFFIVIVGPAVLGVMKALAS
ncbi:MAG: type II secretion system F family protein [Thiolinea sp.]